MAELPLRSTDVSAEDADSTPRVVGVDSDDADDLLGVLSSDTARAVLAAIHDEPAPPSKLADRLDMSLQRVHYHLQNLEAAGVVEIVDTIYSEKGREMNVYAPAHGPIVVFAGDDRAGDDLRQALSSLLGAVGILAVASLFVQQVWGGGIADLFGGSSSPESDVEVSFTGQAADQGRAVSDAASTVEPGILFFAGGLLVVALAFGFWYWRTR